MRIKRLILENFAPILAGLKKERIELDLEAVTSKFIIFIGPIGSGKTYVLSHLQPYAEVGTLDIRNADDPILPEKDGKKVFECEKDGHEYIMTHTYLWTGKSHTKKHSLLKDDVELNPNGNRVSFLELVKLELGIDPSFLRLVRIGSNVSNFISMKATERKSFIANLLKDTEIYLYLYKCWSADLRTINTKVNILMNKITTFSKTPLEELKHELEDLKEDQKEVIDRVDQLKQKRSDCKAETNTLVGNRSMEEFKEYQASLKSNLSELEISLSTILLSLKEYDTFPPEKEINLQIGKLDANLAHNIEKIDQMTDTYETCIRELNKCLDERVMRGDPSHIQTLKDQYQELTSQMESMKSQIVNLNCSYSVSFLNTTLDDINAMNMIINEISQYDKKSVGFVFHSDSSILQYASKKVNILTARKIKVQKLMSNLQFSDGYEPTQLMFLPPFCPTKTCPYYSSHPCTIKRREGNRSSINSQLKSYQDELKELDVEIYQYDTYPLLYHKIKSLKEYWKKVSPVLSNIGALYLDSLEKVIELAHYQVWYHYDKIIDTMDLIEKRDRYYSLTETIKEIKNELSQFEIQDDHKLDEKIVALQDQKISLEKEIEKEEVSKSENQSLLSSYNETYVKLSNKSNLEKERDSLLSQKESYMNELSDLEKKESIIMDNISIITNLDRDIVEAGSELSSIEQKIDILRTKINDISYTSKELEELLQEQKWMTWMVDAVSAKKGIPMKMVKMFFDSCRGSINDMLYMVSGDDFEIVDFEIGEKEFKIPYMVNGIITDDIIHASQGQTSLASLAISFALVKELMYRSSENGNIYNIPLLDEPDACIQKSDRSKMLSILMKYLDDIQSEQCFIISHNIVDLMSDSDIQLVCTSSDTIINEDKYPNAIFL